MKCASTSGSSKSQCFRVRFRFQVLSSKCFSFHIPETNLVKRVKEERVPGDIKRGRPKKSWDEVVK